MGTLPQRAPKGATAKLVVAASLLESGQALVARAQAQARRAGFSKASTSAPSVSSPSHSAVSTKPSPRSLGEKPPSKRSRQRSSDNLGAGAEIAEIAHSQTLTDTQDSVTVEKSFFAGFDGSESNEPSQQQLIEEGEFLDMQTANLLEFGGGGGLYGEDSNIRMDNWR